MTLRPTFWGVVAALTGAVLGALLTNSDFYDRAIYFCIILIVISFVWTIISVRQIAISRHARGLRQQFGSIFEEQYEIKNPLRYSRAWLEVEDGADLPGAATTRVFSSIKARTSRNFSTYTLLSRRGEYLLSPTTLKSGDPFGLFSFKRIIQGEKKLLVLPYLFEISTFPFPVGLLPGGSAVRRKTPEVQPPRVSSVREYSPSDALNRIHWPTTARKDRLMVKEFEQDPQADIWIFLDSQESVHVKGEVMASTQKAKAPLWWLQQIHGETITLPDDTYEYSTSIAGTIARFLSRKGQVVGFASEGKARLVLSAEKGERQLSKILETIALLKCDGKLSFPAMIQSLTGQIPKGSTIIIITPSTSEKIIVTISHLLQKGMKPVVVLLDPFSFNGLHRPDQLVSGLARWKIPYVVIEKGDNIKEKLEKGFSWN
jgi:uncharacterized protein (DUF58 family)